MDHILDLEHGVRSRVIGEIGKIHTMRDEKGW
jgi:hypothetical protein